MFRFFLNYFRAKSIRSQQDADKDFANNSYRENETFSHLRLLNERSTSPIHLNNFKYQLFPTSQKLNRFVCDELLPEDGKKILEEEFRLKDVGFLGAGCFGVVYTAFVPANSTIIRLNRANRNVAIKVYLFGRRFDWFNDQGSGLQSAFNSHRFKSFRSEAKVLKSLNHENIIRFFDCFQVFSTGSNEERLKMFRHADLRERCADHLLIAGVVIEQMDSSLQNWISNGTDEHTLRSIFLQIGGALRYMHQTHNITHSDLKPDNVGVIFSQRGFCDQPDDHIFKLIDFSNARSYDAKYMTQANLHSATCTMNDEDEVHNFVFMPTVFDLAANPFLGESFEFGLMLMKLAIPHPVYGNSSDQIRRIFAEISANYKDTALSRCIMRMCPLHGSAHHRMFVTIDWIMQQYEQAQNEQ